MQGREVSVPTSLQAIANKADIQPGYRFRNLYGLLNEEMLKDSWQYIRKDVAYGVDRVGTAADDGNKYRLVFFTATPTPSCVRCREERRGEGTEKKLVGENT
jgi:hypothetical protein